MLARNSHVFNGFKALVAAGLLTGCIVTEGTGTLPTTTGTGSGTGGDGGAAATTTATSGTTGTGGGVSCVGETGKAVIDDCDGLKITPVSHGGGASPICGANLDEEPAGYYLCTHAFDLFNT